MRKKSFDSCSRMIIIRFVILLSLKEMNLLGNIALMDAPIIKNDFSSYLTGEELVARADKHVMQRAILLKKQLRENRTDMVNGKNLTHA